MYSRLQSSPTLVPGVFFRCPRAVVRQPIDRVHHGAKTEPLTFVGGVDEHREQQAHREPHARPDEGLLDVDYVGLAVK
jgi:hypothetical protein